MLMIALTVDHDIPATLARIITPSARVSTIMFSATATGTLASAAIAALVRRTCRLRERRHLMLVEPAVLVQRLDQRVRDRGFPGDGRGGARAPRRFRTAVGHVARPAAGWRPRAAPAPWRRPWRAASDRDAAASSAAGRCRSRGCRRPRRGDQPVKPRSVNSAPGLLTVLCTTSSLPRRTSTSVTAPLSTFRVEIAIRCAWLLLRAVSISASSSSRSIATAPGPATSIRSSNASARMVSGGAVSIGARRLASSALAEVSMCRSGTGRRRRTARSARPNSPPRR
jgi:hypothetical protein